ncbi:ABC transporter substrate-binding protein [Dactylosporangium sp. NPDC000555]|uniref:ABC transporter substrate-binding protein n=1 Tax=Dactylosporangium sp. NPDC000555 TaxID=3154260 RepID=UPI00333263A4
MAAIVLPLSACDSTADAGGDAGRAGGRATLLVSPQPATFDPATLPSVGTSDAPVGYALYDNLFRIDYNTGAVIPRLAQSVTPNADATVWTIALRPGLTFSDGTSLDAAAVKYNWDRIKDNPQLGSQCYTTVQGFTSVDVASPTELRVTLPERRGSFPQQLFGNGNLYTGTCTNIASPTALQKHGARYGTSPETTVGAGPFVLKEAVPGDHLTLVRNPRYWDAPRPYLDEITVKPSRDITTSVNAVMSGAAQLAAAQALTPDIGRYEQAGFKYYMQPMNGAAMVILNASKPPLDDVRVRRALTLATDLDDLAKKNFFGTVSTAGGWFDKSSYFYDPQNTAKLTQATNGLAEAQQLIDAYVAEKGPVSVSADAGGTTLPLYTTLQQQWQRLHNVQMNVNMVTGTSSNDRLLTGKVQVALNQSGANDPEAMFASFGIGGPQNYLKWSDPELNTILAQARAELDPAAQKPLMVRAAERLVELHWFIMLYRPGAPTLVAKNVTNIQFHDPSQVDLAQVRLK